MIMTDVTVGPPPVYEIKDVFTTHEPGKNWRAKECLDHLEKAVAVVAEEITKNAMTHGVVWVLFQTH
jgi:hypothetical protein